DFSIAGILESSSTAPVLPQLSSPSAKDEARYGCDPTHSCYLDLSATHSPLSPTATLNSPSSSVKLINAFPTSQSECRCNGQIPLSDYTKLSSSFLLTSSPTSLIVRMETLPQHCDPPINSVVSIPYYLHHYHPPTLPSGISRMTSNHPYWCPHFYSSTSFNMRNTIITSSPVKPAVSSLNFFTTRVVESNIDNNANKSGMVDDRVNFLTISNEMSKKEQGIWRCPECEKTYSSSASLRMHKQSHSRPWKCRVCDKTFSRKWILVVHERKHTGERPFVCPVCQHAFALRSGMRRHMQTRRVVKRYVYSHCL
ncbi:Zinc finger protein SNAI2, partial [Taenia solium]